MTLDDSILKDFVAESKSLISESLEILEDVETHPAKFSKLEVYGNTVDRIMGAAKSLALMVPPTHPLHFIGDYSALCKAVGYKSAQIKGNPDFLMICVALLLDATETLAQMIDKVSVDSVLNKTPLSKTFLERLTWVSEQFGADVSATVSEKKTKSGADDIEALLKKLGLE